MEKCSFAFPLLSVLSVRGFIHRQGVEHLQELADFSKANLQKDNKLFSDESECQVVTGDGRLGWPEGARESQSL